MTDALHPKKEPGTFPPMVGSLGILFSLCLLMFMAYRGFSVIFFAPVFALLAASIAGLSIMPTYTELFLPQLAGYVKVYFPFFLLGAVFGKLMEQSGSAESIAHFITSRLGTKHAMLAIVLSCAVLTYGGVSLFVVAFAVYPFANSLFKDADIPKRLLPPTIALGAFTFTMDALPGTPQIQNSIPMKFFNTDLYAAPLFGSIGAALVFVLGMIYLESQRRKVKARGEGYVETHSGPAVAQKLLPSPLLAVAPLLTVLIVTLLLQKFIFPNYKIADWATEAPYNIAPENLQGTMNNWALMIGLASGIALVSLLNVRRMQNHFATAISAGSIGSLLAVMNTASEVGFGNVVKTLDGFKVLTNGLMNLRIVKGPLFSEAITVNVLSGVTGSASGGMSIALDSFAKDYLKWADETSTSHELLHRVASMASGGMDTLPHNGAVITLLAITGLTHRESYKYIFMITLLKTSIVFLLIAFV